MVGFKAPHKCHMTRQKTNYACLKYHKFDWLLGLLYLCVVPPQRFQCLLMCNILQVVTGIFILYPLGKYLVIQCQVPQIPGSHP